MRQDLGAPYMAACKFAGTPLTRYGRRSASSWRSPNVSTITRCGTTNRALGQNTHYQCGETTYSRSMHAGSLRT